jgi:carotenoid cleavage dioxygenase
MGSNSEGFHSVQRLSEFVGEFPKTDDRYQTQPYRHGWLLGFDPTRSGIAHVDHQTGTTDTWHADNDTTLQEPTFIPKSDKAAEGDGYIVQVATRIKEMRTDVFMFEALRLSEGPFATIRLPLRMRPGYHGCWADASRLSPTTSPPRVRS